MKKIAISFMMVLLLFVGLYFWATSGSLNQAELYPISSKTNGKTYFKDTIGVMTYNIGWLSGMTNNRPMDRSLELYETNSASLLNLLETHEVDILAMQEVDFDSNRSFNMDQLELIQQGLNYPYTAKAVNWDKRYVPFPQWPPKHHFGKVVSGQALTSRFPIESNTIEKLIKPVDQPFYYNALYLDRLIQTNSIVINGQEVVIMNVHLEAFSETTRERHIERVFELFKTSIQNGPTLLVGDFNEPMLVDGETKMSSFYSHPDISSAISEYELKNNLEKHLTFSSETPDQKIDYIFYSNQFIEMVDSKTIKDTQLLSDHLPVFMRFKLKDVKPDLLKS